MQKLQLYIEGQRLDLFKDETVSLTETIQNVKDVAKLFTSFTKTFSLPASSTNNKVFKHYYNFHIVNGFDARIKKDGRIELNTIPYKTGRIKLEGVELKDNVPHTYNITFFGNTVELPDILGEDKLGSLFFTTFNQGPYNSTSISYALQYGMSPTKSKIAPLITHTDRLYYNSGQNTAGTGNLSYTVGSAVLKGVKWDQLKFAIRIFDIILEIEQKYTIANGYNRDIVFSRDFFNSANPAFYELYMWLHRKTGAVEPAQQVTSYTTLVEYDAGSGSQSVFGVYGGNVFAPYGATQPAGNRILDFNIRFQKTSGSNYRVQILENGIPVFISTSSNGSRFFQMPFTIVGGATYTILIISEGAVEFSTIEWEINGTQNYQYYTDTIETGGTFSVAAEFDFIIAEQIPEITIIGFLSGLFKMFSLVAYLDGNGTIVVRPLEANAASLFSTEANLSYYTNADIIGNDVPLNYNISNFIETSKSTVNVALPYNEIVYGYEGTGSFLAKQHNQLSGSNWGTLSYSGAASGGPGGVNYNASTEIYKVLLPFEHFKYERLIDVNTSLDTDIQWGWSVNDNRQSYIGKPLLFYAVLITDGTAISFINDNDTISPLTRYIIPSNSLYLDPAVGKQNINFSNEINEYTRTNDFTDTLFSTFHSEYIIDIFNQKRRLTKITSYLPLRILFAFKLNDTFQINADRYTINSITTNIQSGKSEMELLNLAKPDAANAVGPNTPYVLLPPDSLAVASFERFSITVSWNTPDIFPIRTLVQLDGVQVADLDGETTVYTIPNLDPSTSYSVQVFAKDQFGNISVGSNVITQTTQQSFSYSWNFAVGPGNKLGWTASGNSGGLQSRQLAIVWTLLPNAANQIMQSPDDLNLNFIGGQPTTVLMSISKIFGDEVNGNYTFKIFDNGTATNVPFTISGLTTVGQGTSIIVNLPTLSGTGLYRFKIQRSTGSMVGINAKLGINQIILSL